MWLRVLICVMIGKNLSYLNHPEDNMTDWTVKEDVLKAVKKNGLDLQKASSALRADKNVVITALKQNSLALKFADENLKYQDDMMGYAFDQYLIGLIKPLLGFFMASDEGGGPQKKTCHCFKTVSRFASQYWSMGGFFSNQEQQPSVKSEVLESSEKKEY
ncbi:MAG: DUF4116 domain-containing protein [Candidatus Comchoanobacterales bacterium]